MHIKFCVWLLKLMSLTILKLCHYKFKTVRKGKSNSVERIHIYCAKNSFIFHKTRKWALSKRIGKVLINLHFILASYELPCRIYLPLSTSSSYCERYNKRECSGPFLPSGIAWKDMGRFSITSNMFGTEWCYFKFWRSRKI